MNSIMLLLLIFVTPVSFANHLGTFGQTFPIVEADFLAEIQTKLNNLVATGAMQQHQINIQNKITESVHRPTPVAGLIKTLIPKVFWYDPSIKVPYDLKDHKGQVFAMGGTIVNPLDYYSLRQTLLFIDGCDQSQLAWAKTLPKNRKVILVNGSPFEFMQQQQERCYFDQNGKLIKKFGISQIPAQVKQDGKLLKITEVLLNE